LQDRAREARLLASIAARGVETPLEGVDTPEGRILLHGFKRWRCARKLQLASVPYVSLARDEAMGILALMGASREKSLSVLEEAKFLLELLTVHGLELAEVAEKLSRSKGWVSMRRRLLEEISPAIQQLLFSGKFPVYSYLYTLRPFMRMNEVSSAAIERFVQRLARQRLSVRDIERLADLYFRGPASLREAIEAGKLSWALEQMQRVGEDQESCNVQERVLLKELLLLQKTLRRVLTKCRDRRLTSRAFHAQANLLTAGLLADLPLSTKAMEELHDRSGQA
jgi:ParB/RepB/Spo0J family partition protein